MASEVVKHAEDTNHFFCIGCHQLHELNSLFVWTDCKHEYGAKCVINIINESLSFLNEIPKCVAAKCEKLLNIQDAEKINNHLLEKYKMNKHNVIVYDHEEHLIYGYIRRINKNMPNELILTIFDYFNLIYFTKINCYQCKTRGYEVSQCQKCNGIGYITDCTQCQETGIHQYSIKCIKCDGSGDYIRIYECNKCDGRKAMIVLDFNKVCNKQSLCCKCNIYFPNDMVVYWNNCHHIVCHECAAKYIRALNRIKYKIPAYLSPACNQQLSVQKLLLVAMSNINIYINNILCDLKALVNGKLKYQNVIKQIDNGLKRYYQHKNAMYLDNNGIGKFAQWVEDNGYDSEGIIDEFLQIEPAEVAFIDFDENFPTTETTEYEKIREIFVVLHICFKEQGAFINSSDLPDHLI